MSLRTIATKVLYYCTWFDTESTKEHLVVSTLLRHGSIGVQGVIQYLDGIEKFHRISVRDYVSPGGYITVCDDIYGFEVKIGGPYAKLLDCSPSYYKLTREEAIPLYEAILACIPGSTMFANKMTRNRSDTTSPLYTGDV